jgi:hypothetical protein
MKYLLTVFFLATLLATAKSAHAQGLDLSQSSQQLRVLGAYGLSYTAKHFYRDQLGASKEMSWILTAVTTIGLGYALDSASSQVSQGNLMAYGIGMLGGSFMHSIFDGDEAPKGYKEREEKEHKERLEQRQKFEQKNEQKVNLNISLAPGSTEYVVTSNGNDKRVKSEVKRRGGKTFTHTSPLFQE